MTRPITALGILVAGLSLGACAPSTGVPAAPSPTTPTPAPEPSESSPLVEGVEGDRPTDEDMKQALMRELRSDSSIDETRLGVRLSDGIVQLTGTVETLLAKDRATRIAEAIRGVRAVSNRLRVDVPDKPAPQLETAVRTAFALNHAADSYEIEVRADKGVVTLAGEVDSWPEKELAIRLAKGVSGVREVVDELVVTYEGNRSDAEIAADARARLRWDVLVDDAMIDVKVDDGVVKLSGSVGSPAEKRQAIGDAYVLGASAVDATALAVTPWADRESLRDRKHIPRDDAAIAEAIQDAAVYDPRLYSFDVVASVDHGRVTLTGTVATQSAKLAAERLANHTVGVISVINHIQVVPPEVESEAALARRVESALDLNPITEAQDIRATASGSEITLTGTVDSFYEKAEVSDVAQGVAGVGTVKNLLRVREPLEPFVYGPHAAELYPLVEEWTQYIPEEPALPDDELKEAIDEELFWEPFASAWQIDVTVSKGVATLSGVVDSPTEAATAIANAYQAGAIEVENELDVR